MNIGDKISRLREINGLSQDQLAEILGCKRSTIAQIERGARKVWAADVKKLADHFGIPPGWFFDENFNPPCQKDQPGVKISDLLDEIKGFLEKDRSLHPRAGIIQLPAAENPRTLKYISQPVGAGKTLADCPVEGLLKIVASGYPTHAFLVRGNSMEPDIPDNSLLIVRATGLNWKMGWKDGDVCVVYIEPTDEWTVKKVRILDRNRIVLTGTDGNREIADLKNVRIQGVVEDVVKDPEKIMEILDSLTDGDKNQMTISRQSKESPDRIKGKLKDLHMEDIRRDSSCDRIDPSLKERRVDALKKGAVEEKLDKLIELMKVQVNILEDVKKNAEQNEILAGVNYLLERGEISAEEADCRLKRAGVNPRDKLK